MKDVVRKNITPSLTELGNKLDEARLMLADVERDFDYFKTNYDACYQSINQLGEALGHPSGAQTVSARTLMEQYIREVCALTGRTVVIPEW